MLQLKSPCKVFAVHTQNNSWRRITSSEHSPSLPHEIPCDTVSEAKWSIQFILENIKSYGKANAVAMLSCDWYKLHNYRVSTYRREPLRIIHTKE